MRWSSLFIPTLRDAPAEADAASHRLLVRGGFIRQLQSGHYSMKSGRMKWSTSARGTFSWIRASRERQWKMKWK